MEPAPETKLPHERSFKGDSLIQVSNKKDIKFFLYIARQILNNHSEVEITAIGESISNAIMVGETLCRNKQTKWKQITTETVDSKPQEGIPQRNSKKIKVCIKLTKV